MPASPTVRLHRLAAELRRIHEQSGATIEQVADHVGCQHPKISRIYNAHRAPSIPDVHRILDFYGTSGPEFDRLIELTKDARKKGWWHTYSDVMSEWYAEFVGLEAEASTLLTYEAECIPGLLQTEDYARALTMATLVASTEEQIARRVELRVERQKRLTEDHPVELWAVVSEAALWRLVGGADVHRAQLRHLLKLMDLPHVTVQVMPFSAGAHPAQVGPFVIIQFPDQIHHDVVYLEHQVGALYVEDDVEVSHYRKLMDHLKVEARDTQSTVDMINRISREL